MKLQKVGMVEEAKKAKFLPNGFLQVLIFLGIFFISQFGISILIGFVILIQSVINGESPDDLINQANFYMLFGTLAISIIAIIYVLLIEKRNLKSMGLIRQHAIKDYFIGYVVGLGLFSSAIVILVVTNNMKYSGMNALTTVLPMVIAFFIGYLLQGSEEEIMSRGYLMPSLAARHNLIIAVIINGSLFGALHLFNPNVTFLSILNIILFGVFASIYTLKLNSLWGICAVHSAWNFVQGNIFGLQVSGLSKTDSIWKFEVIGKDYMTGGDFGPEGGLAVTFVLCIGLIILFCLKLHRNDPFNVGEANE